ncbi:hypothetical protein PV327_011563, partial [Microctonus hyperodae]
MRLGPVLSTFSVSSTGTSTYTSVPTAELPSILSGRSRPPPEWFVAAGGYFSSWLHLTMSSSSGSQVTVGSRATRGRTDCQKEEPAMQ